MKKFLCKKFGHLLLPAIIISLALGVETTFAAEDTFQKTLQVWGRGISLLGSLINLLLWIVIKFIGDLLTNDFIFGAGIEDMLKSIWQTVRNFVNIAFVFVLLVIAFYNIVSIDPEKIPLKKSLGKVAIALILVNFSYFAAKVVLDVANVLTTAVFAIPRDIITDLQLSTAEMEYGNDAIGMTCSKRAYLDQIGNSSDPAGAVEATDEFLYQNNLFGQIKYDPDENDPEKRSYVDLPTKCYIPNLIKIKLFKDNVQVEDGVPFAIANYDELRVVLFYKDDAGVIHPFDEDMVQVTKGEKTLSKFEETYKGAELSAKKFGRNTITMILAKTMFDLNKLTEISAASTTGVFGLTISGIVNLLLLILYGTMFVAMFIVLIFRVVYLWICIAFSPLVALMFVFKDFGIDMPDEANISKLFIKYAFVPVKMGIALSVGVLMIFQANRQTLGQEETSIGEKAADIQIPIDTLVNDSSIQKLMWNIATVAVIWIAIKWSLKDLSGPVQGIVDKITGYVGAVGEVAAKIPLTLPIAPYWEDKEGGERKMTTFGAVLRSARASNLNEIVEAAIRGEDRAAVRARMELSDKLDRITTDSSEDKGKLADITRNNEYMSQVMIEENKDIREKLAQRLVLQGALREDDVKAWDGSAAGFRALLRDKMDVEPQGFYFKRGTDFDKDWQTGAAAGGGGLASLNAKDSILLGGKGAANESLWVEDKDKRDTAETSIKTDIGRLEAISPGAASTVKSSLKLEASADGTQYSAEATQRVLKEAVDKLIEANGLQGDARKNAGSSLKGRAKALFDAAVGKLPSPQPPAGGGGGAGGTPTGGTTPTQ